MKTTIALLILFVAVLGGGYALYTHSQPPATEMTAETPASTEAAPASSGEASGESTSAAATPAAGTYTSAQVASHNTASSCWSSIEGSVYDLTAWISKHPGGAARILGICGKDGTSAFEGMHGQDARAAQMLATFKIGTLAS